MTPEEKRTRRLAQMARRNAWGNVNPHTPDGNMPRTLTRHVRHKCIQMQLNPGITQDVKLAIIEVGYEFPEFQRTWFHPEYLANLAKRMAANYRQMSFLRKHRLQIEALNFSPTVD